MLTEEMFVDDPSYWKESIARLTEFSAQARHVIAEEEDEGTIAARQKIERDARDLVHQCEELIISATRWPFASECDAELISDLHHLKDEAREMVG